MSLEKQQGFTLLEILMAIFIFAIVITLAYSSFNASFRIINNTSSQAATYSMAKVAMERIQEDLESFYPAEEMIFKGHTETIGDHRADSLEFTSSANVRLHPKQKLTGYVIISYQVKEDPETKTLHLFRSEKPAFTESDENDDKSKQLLLCTNLLEVAFDYRNSDGMDVTEWEGKKDRDGILQVPELISISLRFVDSGANRKEEETEERGILFKTSLIILAGEI
jgi:general secretion pathway protein J